MYDFDELDVFCRVMFMFSLFLVKVCMVKDELVFFLILFWKF